MAARTDEGALSTSRLVIWQRRIAAVVEQQDVAAMRRLAMAAAVIQLALCFAAAMTRVMLYGDGAYFVYSLSVDQAWLLKWREVAARASAYILTVAPTRWIADAVDLTPLSIASLNGFVFYVVPLIQFAIACALVWKSHPKFLVFPVAQYAILSAMGFGFPSEILLSPGFLWMALFCILRNQAVSVLFLFSFIALLFSHELAALSAVILAYLAMKQARGDDRRAGSQWRFATMLVVILAATVALIVVRMSGGGTGSNQNAIYVADPRRVLNNPSYFVLLAVVVITLSVAARFGQSPLRRVVFQSFIIIVASLPFLLQFIIPNINFDHGRYDSARSIIGFGMLALTFSFVAARAQLQKVEYLPSKAWIKSIPMVLTSALAVSLGSNALFLRDWTIALRGFTSVVGIAPSDASPEFLSYGRARGLMTEDEARANDRMEFQWVLPFKSIVVADGNTPGRIVYGEADLHGICQLQKSITLTPAAVPISVINSMQTFACTFQGPPEPNTITKKTLATARAFLTYWFGRKPDLPNGPE